jgi:hypothetical protein
MHLDGGSKSTKQVSAKMYVHLQKSLLLFHRKHLGLAEWAIAKALYATIMPGRAAAFRVLGMLGRGERWRAHYQQAAAAARYHLLRTETQA